jgi:hypothetical protein
MDGACEPEWEMLIWKYERSQRVKNGISGFVCSWGWFEFDPYTMSVFII